MGQREVLLSHYENNKHARTIDKPIKEVAALLSSLSSNNDQLWPHERWSPMKLDRELTEGATGGHGPIHYVVTEYSQAKKSISDS